MEVTIHDEPTEHVDGIYICLEKGEASCHQFETLKQKAIDEIEEQYGKDTWPIELTMPCGEVYIFEVSVIFRMDKEKIKFWFVWKLPKWLVRTCAIRLWERCLPSM